MRELDYRHPRQGDRRRPTWWKNQMAADGRKWRTKKGIGDLILLAMTGRVVTQPLIGASDYVMLREKSTDYDTIRERK
jgi:hypothetical protein